MSSRADEYGGEYFKAAKTQGWRSDLPCIQVGFEQVLTRSELVTCISYCLYANSKKLRAQVADMLAALCVLSMSEGHRVVMAALSDFRVEHGEHFRFEYLISSIRLDGLDSQEDPLEGEPDEAALWEYRTAAMALINAITNSPDDLEERIALRDEFSRRGLDVVIQVTMSVASMICGARVNFEWLCRVCATPTRLNLSLHNSGYMLKSGRKIKRICASARSVKRCEWRHLCPSFCQVSVLSERPSDSIDISLSQLIGSSRRHEHAYPLVVDTVRTYINIANRDTDEQVLLLLLP
jgi:hypothetical protein